MKHAEPFGESFALDDEGGHCDACGDDELDLRGVRFVSEKGDSILVCEGCIEEMNNACNAKWHE